MNSQLVELIKSAAQEKKAVDFRVVDMAGKSDICDSQIVCSGASARQTVAIANSIESRLKSELKLIPLAIEGRNSGHWIAIDYGNTIVHIFTSEQRNFYAIEELWADK